MTKRSGAAVAFGATLLLLVGGVVMRPDDPSMGGGRAEVDAGPDALPPGLVVARGVTVRGGRVVMADGAQRPIRLAVERAKINKGECVEVPSLAGDIVVDVSEFCPAAVARGLDHTARYHVEHGEPAARRAEWEGYRALLTSSGIGLPLWPVAE